MELLSMINEKAILFIVHLFCKREREREREREINPLSHNLYHIYSAYYITSALHTTSTRTSNHQGVYGLLYRLQLGTIYSELATSKSTMHYCPKVMTTTMVSQLSLECQIHTLDCTEYQRNLVVMDYPGKEASCCASFARLWQSVWGQSFFH